MLLFLEIQSLPLNQHNCWLLLGNSFDAFDPPNSPLPPHKESINLDNIYKCLSLTSDIRSNIFLLGKKRGQMTPIHHRLQICVLIQGAFLCQLLKHRQRMGVIFPFKQEGLTILQGNITHKCLPCCCNKLDTLPAC